MLYKLFTEKELQKINEWDEVQREKMPKDENGFLCIGAIGGYLTYEFTPNSIGMTKTVYNSVTKDRLDATDYSEW